MLMSLYKVVQGKLPPMIWSGIWREDGGYPVAVGLVWLALDVVLFFVLFVVFNVAGARPFGLPLLDWREVMNPCAWRRLLKTQSRGCIERLRVEGLAMVYEGLHSTEALQGVSFGVTRGDCVVVIGPNGAGKSTLLKSLTGMIKPTSGTLTVDDEPATARFDSLWRRLGVCFQENTLLPELTVKEHCWLFGALRGLNSGKLAESVDYLGSVLDLGDSLETCAGQLSGGQKRKLCVGLSLLGEPAVVIADEPASGVDINSCGKIWQALSNLRNTITIVTSHALEEAVTNGGRLFVMTAGRLAFDGTAAELRKDHGGCYTLRADCEDFEGCVECVRKLEPAARRVPGRAGTLTLPISRGVARVVKALESGRAELGLRSYSLFAQPLESMLNEFIAADAVREKCEGWNGVPSVVSKPCLPAVLGGEPEGESGGPLRADLGAASAATVDAK
jgi:ABC-type multidrug transport system ATPase subunit